MMDSTLRVVHKTVRCWTLIPHELTIRNRRRAHGSSMRKLEVGRGEIVCRKVVLRGDNGWCLLKLMLLLHIEVGVPGR